MYFLETNTHKFSSLGAQANFDIERKFQETISFGVIHDYTQWLAVIYNKKNTTANGSHGLY